MILFSDVLIYGGGGHGKVIADILELTNYRITGFLDDSVTKKRSEFFGYPILGQFEDKKELIQNQNIFVAIGDNNARAKCTRLVSLNKMKLINAFHPNSIRAKVTTFENGICMMAGAIVNPGSRIEKGVILNTASTIDHDCHIKQFAQISPGVNVAGSVSIGKLSFIGTGAQINPGITIGDHTIIGSGTVIINDIPDNATVVGNPGKIIKIDGKNV